MPKAVIDTNILISALVFGGIPFEIIQAARAGRFEMVLSHETLAEQRRVVNAKFPDFAEELARFEVFLAGYAIITDSPSAYSYTGLRDDNDTHILHAAQAGGADYIVSGDKDLLVLEVFQGVPVVRPKEFLARLEQP